MRRSRPDHHRWQRSLWLSLLFSENTYGFFLLHLPHHQRHPPHRSCSGRRFRRTSMIHSYSSSPTDGNSPDFYKVLNVPRTATPAQIKQAYRNMAKRYHPGELLHWISCLCLEHIYVGTDLIVPRLLKTPTLITIQPSHFNK